MADTDEPPAKRVKADIKHFEVPADAYAGPADIVLKTSDGHECFCHSAFLRVNCRAFGGMLDAASGCDTPTAVRTAGLPLVVLEETSEVLDLLLPYCYNMPRPNFPRDSFDLQLQVAEAAAKYENRRAMETIGKDMLTEWTHGGDVLRAFDYACKHDLQDLREKLLVPAVKYLQLSGAISHPAMLSLRQSDKLAMHDVGLKRYMLLLNTLQLKDQITNGASLFCLCSHMSHALIASRYYQAAIKMVICFLHDEVEDADDVFSDWDEMVGAQPDACAEAHRFRRNLDNTILKWKQVGAVRDVAEINRLYRAMEEDMEI